MSTAVPEAAAPKAARRRVLGARDVTLFTISAILVIDQLTASASIGTSVLGWWLIALVVFLVPSAFISAELSTTYPDQGGLYVWVKQAFGRRWAARTTYWYWVNVALWMPSVMLLFAGVFAELFVPDLGKWPQTLIALALTWLIVGIGIVKLDTGKWVNNVGAILKSIILLTLIGGGIWFAIANGPANDLNLGQMLTPDFNAAKFFLPVLIYQLLGFELVATMGEEIKNPAKVMPRAIGLSALVLSLLYVGATLGILLALPLEDLGIVVGLVDTFKAIFGASALGEAAVYVLGVAALYTFISNMATWSMGANRAAVEAADGGELPTVFAREHPRHRTPVAAFLLMGVVSSVVLLGSTALLNEQDTLYYALFAASSVVFLLPYLLTFPTFLRLRRTDPDTTRPYRAPGGKVGAWAWTILTTGTIFAVTVLFLWTPGDPVDWAYTGSLLTIVGVTLIVGEVLVGRSLRKIRVPDTPAALVDEHTHV